MSDTNKTTFRLLQVTVHRDDMDSLTELLWELGTSGFEEATDGERIRVSAYFPADFSPGSLEQSFREGVRALPTDDLSISVFECRPDDWVENYSKNFKGFPVGETFYIYPGWEEPDSEYPINLLLEPGHGFGTGTHESTQLVMLALVDLAPQARTLLDVGTGSGILSIAARKLNPCLSVTALDIDDMAVEFAARNIERNGVSPVRLFVGDTSGLGGSFEIVLANVTCNIIRVIAADLCRLGRDNLVLSGFTVDQEILVRDAINEYSRFSVAQRFELNEWVCLDLKLCSES